jgi:hypothetical protein
VPVCNGGVFSATKYMGLVSTMGAYTREHVTAHASDY